MEKENTVIDLLEGFSKENIDDVKYIASKPEVKNGSIMKLLSNPKVISLLSKPEKIKNIMMFACFLMIIGLFSFTYITISAIYFLFTHIF